MRPVFSGRELGNLAWDTAKLKIFKFLSVENVRVFEEQLFSMFKLNPLV
jgi:hypothetical protein